MRTSKLGHEFVNRIPETVNRGTLYVAMDLAIAVHRCCCGCEQEVVTPISPTDWKLTYDGDTVSLSPSIGNWSFRCQSHYWVVRNEIRWANPMIREQIEAGRAGDRRAKQGYYHRDASAGRPAAEVEKANPGGFLAGLRSWIRRQIGGSAS